MYSNNLKIIIDLIKNKYIKKHSRSINDTKNLSDVKVSKDINKTRTCWS